MKTFRFATSILISILLLSIIVHLFVRTDAYGVGIALIGMLYYQIKSGILETIHDDNSN